MNDVEVRQLRYFVAVAEESHFGRAATRLGMAQPPLSRAIRELERQLGVTLFERTTRQVRLTAAGEVLLREARESGGCAMPSRVAARPKCDSSATATKYRSCRTSTSFIPSGYQPRP